MVPSSLRALQQAAIRAHNSFLTSVCELGIAPVRTQTTAVTGEEDRLFKRAEIAMYLLPSDCRMDSRKPLLSYVVLPAERTESPIGSTDLRIDECMKTSKLPTLG